MPMNFRWIKLLTQSNSLIPQLIEILFCPIFTKNSKLKQQSNLEICKNTKNTSMFGKEKNSWLGPRQKRKAQYWWIIILNRSMFIQIKIKQMWSIILLYIIGKWAWEIIIPSYKGISKVTLSRKFKKRSCCNYEKESGKLKTLFLFYQLKN
jgi:hypothetical protein